MMEQLSPFFLPRFTANLPGQIAGIYKMPIINLQQYLILMRPFNIETQM